MMQRTIGCAVVALACGLFLSATSNSAWARTDTDFFRHKTITYVIATNPGGGYDFYGRLIARHIVEHLPASQVTVRNISGRNHALGADAVYNAAPDGLTIGTFSPALIYDQLIGRDTVRFDLGKMSWIGNTGADPRIMVVGTNSPIRTINDLHQPGDAFYFGVSRVGSVNYNETKILQDVLSFNAQIIIGYKGKDDERALEDRSIDAVFGPRSHFGSFVGDGYGRVIFQVGGEHGSVPHLADLIKNGNEDARNVVALMQSQAELAHPTAGPPGIPAKRLEALREAFQKTLQDPKVHAEAAAAGYSLAPFAIGKSVGDAVALALNQSPNTIAIIARTLSVPPPPLQMARAPSMKALH